MSLFVAVQPPEAVAVHLDDQLALVRRDPAADALHWQSPSRWHVTLAFLGDVDESAWDSIADAVADVSRAQGPVGPLTLRGADMFGRQILWIGVTDAGGAASTPLSDVAASVQSAMRRLRVPLERRPWRPHLTIARIRNGDPGHALRQLADYCGPEWTADEVALVVSAGGPMPGHRAIDRFRLTGPRA
jgi:2'-5' RNA ligase